MVLGYYGCGIEMSCCDACEYCGKQFKERHYSWFICIDCHKQNQQHDEKGYGYNERLANKEELT